MDVPEERERDAAMSDNGLHMALLPLKLFVPGARGCEPHAPGRRWCACASETRACRLCILNSVILLIFIVKQQSKHASGKIGGSGGSMRDRSCRVGSMPGVQVAAQQ